MLKIYILYWLFIWTWNLIIFRRLSLLANTRLRETHSFAYLWLKVLWLFLSFTSSWKQSCFICLEIIISTCTLCLYNLLFQRFDRNSFLILFVAAALCRFVSFFSFRVYLILRAVSGNFKFHFRFCTWFDWRQPTWRELFSTDVCVCRGRIVSSDRADSNAIVLFAA